MSERDLILGRIREALRAKAPPPGHHGAPSTQASDAKPADHAREWLPPGGDNWDEQLARFQANSTDLRTEFVLLAGEAELAATIAAIREREGWRRAASHRGALTQLACKAAALPVVWTGEKYDITALEQCDVGFTECDALIAQTGSVLVTSRTCGGRALSVLPPHHVVLARRDQMLPDLPAALALIKRKYAPDYPSMISFITGPSRTGDIERILVLGAHGPKKLTILCW